MWFAPFFDTYQYLECETPTRVCKTGPALPTGVYPQFVANSSRP
jgi:hypothetical protein